MSPEQAGNAVFPSRLRGAAHPVVAWLFLVAATIMSTWLGAEYDSATTTVAGAVVIVVAFVKIRVVVSQFMGLSQAAAKFIRLFDAWCALGCAALVCLYAVG